MKANVINSVLHTPDGVLTLHLYSHYYLYNAGKSLPAKLDAIRTVIHSSLTCIVHSVPVAAHNHKLNFVDIATTSGGRRNLLLM